jgi:hypothetical protein
VSKQRVKIVSGSSRTAAGIYLRTGPAAAPRTANVRAVGMVGVRDRDARVLQAQGLSVRNLEGLPMARARSSTGELLEPHESVNLALAAARYELVRPGEPAGPSQKRAAQFAREVAASSAIAGGMQFPAVVLDEHGRAGASNKAKSDCACSESDGWDASPCGCGTSASFMSVPLQSEAAFYPSVPSGFPAGFSPRFPEPEFRPISPPDWRTPAPIPPYERGFSFFVPFIPPYVPAIDQFIPEAEASVPAPSPCEVARAFFEARGFSLAGIPLSSDCCDKLVALKEQALTCIAAVGERHCRDTFLVPQMRKFLEECGLPPPPTEDPDEPDPEEPPDVECCESEEELFDTYGVAPGVPKLYGAEEWIGVGLGKADWWTLYKADGKIQIKNERDQNDRQRTFLSIAPADGAATRAPLVLGGQRFCTGAPCRYSVIMRTVRSTRGLMSSDPECTAPQNRTPPEPAVDGWRPDARCPRDYDTAWLFWGFDPAYTPENVSILKNCQVNCNIDPAQGRDEFTCDGLLPDAHGDRINDCVKYHFYYVRITRDGGWEWGLRHSTKLWDQVPAHDGQVLLATGTLPGGRRLTIGRRHEIEVVQLDVGADYPGGAFRFRVKEEEELYSERWGVWEHLIPTSIRDGGCRGKRNPEGTSSAGCSGETSQYGSLAPGENPEGYCCDEGIRYQDGWFRFDTGNPMFVKRIWKRGVIGLYSESAEAEFYRVEKGPAVLADSELPRPLMTCRNPPLPPCDKLRSSIG